MEKIFCLPRHRAPVLHKDAVTISFENCYKIGRTYKEIIGLDNIHHFSLNIVDPNGEMTILSYNPQIAYNIFKDGSYLYNGSISPTFYETREIYTWDEAYDPRKYHLLKNNMERKNGIKEGVVLTKRVNSFILLYSFATKLNGVDFLSEINARKNYFYSAGDFCFERIQSIIDDRILSNCHIPDQCKSPQKSNIIRLK
ncbi:hypothetical protein SDB96_15845 [Legionella pneumophila serogroup 1]|uniref:hypothetical protein n=1 Tax=Legionella pneumophila TaxID=446 RepID=UPI0039C3B039|nr:hypothetical protein [Legionella pneumophila subsp. pneumophila]